MHDAAATTVSRTNTEVSEPRRFLKRVLGWLLFRSGAYRRLLAGRAFVLLFHRVDDRYAGNPISCTTREFDAYCRFFARYFDVVSTSDLLALLESGADLSGKLVITFDDGYADNIAAARMMREHGLTASFFIATDFIGTERDGWWDVEQGQHSHWMTWDDVQQLREWGFEVGAHTRNHVDLGQVDGAEALDEIEGSREALNARGVAVDHFAYPFGGQQHMTPENLEIVRASGFQCCMSAYGGIVTAGSDPYDLQRIPVSPWHRSPWQLGFELLLEKRRPSLSAEVRVAASFIGTHVLGPILAEAPCAAASVCLPVIMS